MPAKDPQPVRPTRFDADLKGPLQGVRVIDLSRLVAGNMLSLQLGDFGADVIKVEPPEGDPLRHWQVDGKSFYWKAYARNKRSVVLDLRSKTEMETFLKLSDQADVLIENFRPGTLEKMGLAPRYLLERNPALILVRISGFGQTGPYARLPGFGTLVEAMSGFAARTGFPDREPVLPPLALADMISGLAGAMAVVTALRARDLGTASGQVIDLSLLEPMVSVLGPEAAIFRETGKVLERVGSASNTSAPRNVYRCRDGGYVALSGSIQTMAMRVFDVIGHPEMKSDPRFSTNSARVSHRSLVDEAVGGWIAERSRDEVLESMRSAGVTVGPVYDSADIVGDQHFRERGVVTEVEDDELGSVLVQAIMPRLGATPGVYRYPAPRLGEHNREVFAEFGIDPDASATLRTKEEI